jgi:hypothetical protein
VGVRAVDDERHRRLGGDDGGRELYDSVTRLRLAIATRASP